MTTNNKAPAGTEAQENTCETSEEKSRLQAQGYARYVIEHAEQYPRHLACPLRRMPTIPCLSLDSFPDYDWSNWHYSSDRSKLFDPVCSGTCWPWQCQFYNPVDTGSQPCVLIRMGARRHE